MVVGVEFEATTRSAPLGCDAAMKIKKMAEKVKRRRFLEWFGPPPE